MCAENAEHESFLSFLLWYDMYPTCTFFLHFAGGKGGKVERAWCRGGESEDGRKREPPRYPSPSRQDHIDEDDAEELRKEPNASEPRRGKPSLSAVRRLLREPIFLWPGQFLNRRPAKCRRRETYNSGSLLNESVAAPFRL